MQLVAIPLSFAVILFLAGRKFSLWKALLAGAVVIGFMSGLSAEGFLRSAGRALVERKTVELVLGVAAVTALAGVLRAYGLLRLMVTSLSRLVGSPRLAVMAVPSAIGALPVNGGAILSAPMVETIGDELGLDPAGMAAVNLIFRHAWFFVVPIFPVFILTCQIAEVGARELVLWQWPMVVVTLVVGYLALLRPRAGQARTTRAEPPDAAGTAGDVAVAGEPRGANLKETLLAFLRSSSPLIIAIALTLGIGPIRTPLCVAVGIGLVWALFLSRRAEGFSRCGLPTAWKGINWDMLLNMALVMVFGGIVKDSGSAGALVSWLQGLGLPSWLLVVAIPLVVSFITGAASSAVGIALPLVLPFAPPGSVIGTTVVCFLAAFVSYLVSPVHLCQVLTAQYFHVGTTDLYRKYWPVVLALAATLAVYVWVVFG